MMHSSAPHTNVNDSCQFKFTNSIAVSAERNQMKNGILTLKSEIELNSEFGGLCTTNIHQVLSLLALFLASEMLYSLNVMYIYPPVPFRSQIDNKIEEISLNCGDETNFF